MSIDVTESTFESEVVSRSRETPVLVDFWAEWCGPCRMLTPVLTDLETKYSGKFILVKVNTDLNQQLASRFQISGIPAVKLFINEEVVDEFVGVLPESTLRSFLDRNLPDSKSSAAES